MAQICGQNSKDTSKQPTICLRIMHNQQHDYCSVLDTMELVQLAWKDLCMNCLETFYIQLYQHQGILIDKQNTGEHNPLLWSNVCVIPMCVIWTESRHPVRLFEQIQSRVVIMDHVLLINTYVRTYADYTIDYTFHFSSVIRNPLVCILYHYGGFNSIYLFLQDCDQFIVKINYTYMDVWLQRGIKLP